MCHTVKTGRWGGVVTAFITMSDIKDEIDWEFPGNATTEGQTNWFWQGIIRMYLSSSIPMSSAQPFNQTAEWPTTHGTTVGNLSYLTDTFQNYHDFTVCFFPRITPLTLNVCQIDWQPDTLKWLIDGAVVRTLKKSDTVNSAGVTNYPSTPSRIQLS